MTAEETIEHIEAALFAYELGQTGPEDTLRAIEDTLTRANRIGLHDLIYEGHDADGEPVVASVYRPAPDAVVGAVGFANPDGET